MFICIVQELAAKLKARLQHAREVRQKPGVQNDDQMDSTETIILTRTDSKGFVRPLKFNDSIESAGSSKRKQKVETHSGGQRVRYFPDDDKYSLQQLVSIVITTKIY